MRALMCVEYGPADRLRFGDVPTPTPAAGQVRIAVQAAGVNFPDVLMIQGRYQFKPEPPFVPGCEVAGIVSEVGAGVQGLEVGDRVAAIVTHGGFAEEVLADPARVFPVPDDIPFDIAAGLMFAHQTSWHALKDRAKLQPGESLLVLGAAGGVGLAAVELGKALGATVIAAASSEAKLAVCREHGADHLIDYATQDLRTRLREIVGEAGVDVVLDPVGGALTEPAFRSTAWEGRYLVLGFAAGEVPRLPLNLPLLKGSAIVGCAIGGFARRFPERSRANAQELLALYAQGKVRPRIGARFPLERAAEAIATLASRAAQGKVIVDIHGR